MRSLELFHKIFVSFFHKAVCSSSVFLLLLFLLCSQVNASWKVDEVKTSNSRYNSARYLYVEQSARLELYKSASGWTGCFSVTSLPLPALPEAPSKSRITLIIDSNEEQLLAHRISGGQKLILPEQTLDRIRHSLKNNSSITLKTGRYTLVVPPIALP